MRRKEGEEGKGGVYEGVGINVPKNGIESVII